MFYSHFDCDGEPLERKLDNLFKHKEPRHNYYK